MLFDRLSFTRTLPALASLALLGLAGLPTYAQTVIGSSNVTLYPTSSAPVPSNVTQGQYEDPINATAFMENQNLVLTGDLNVDISLPGTYKTKKSLTSGTIAAGTDIDSFLFYTDPPRRMATPFSGSITFSNQILGLEVLSDSLDSTDGTLGLATTTYPYKVSSRGLEFATDDITLTVVDPHTITWNYKTSGSVDEVRVITAAVPEPTMALPAGLMLLTGLVLWRRRPARIGQAA